MYMVYAFQFQTRTWELNKKSQDSWLWLLQYQNYLGERCRDPAIMEKELIELDYFQNIKFCHLKACDMALVLDVEEF